MEAPQSSPPTRLGKYELLRKLGEGGMGTVYEGLHTGIGQRVAIKLLRPELCAEPKQVQRFFDEARLVSMVSHPGLIKISDCETAEDGRVYIVMELLEGESLWTRIERLRGKSAADAGAPPLPFPDSLRIVRQVASALSAVHKKGIVHRDLKPENIFLVADPDTAAGERAKILDFGIARLEDTGGEGRRTTSGVALGTPTYMAPEQCEGRPDLTDRVDVYALGVLGFELLTGAPPFRSESASALMRQHLVRPPPPLPPSVPVELSNLLQAMLAKAPEERPSMNEVLAALDATGLAGTTHSSSRAPVAVRRTQRWLLPFAVGGLLALFMGSYFLLRPAPIKKLEPVERPVIADMHAAILPSPPPRVTPCIGTRRLRSTCRRRSSKSSCCISASRCAG